MCSNKNIYNQLSLYNRIINRFIIENLQKETEYLFCVENVQ